METSTAESPVEEFRRRSREAGVEVTRIPVREATAALEDVCEGPANEREGPVVAAPLPWDGVELPDGAITNPSPAELESATTGVTPAIGGIAEYGSLLLRQTNGSHEAASLFPERHVAVVHEADIVPDVAAALSTYGDAFRAEEASIVIATGPSATADMGDLVTGVHGPRVVRAILLEEEP